jgi:glycosyltransferase involved in cell wall biosynthesis
MIILEHSTYDARSIRTHLGSPEYSYWFVRKAFRPILERFGVVIPVTDPESEVDRIHKSAAAHGESCVFFSFNPPHSTTLGLACPTVPVFAWEFDTIPNEVWDADARNDWTTVLRRTPAAITHSQWSVRAVRRSLGETYPIWSVPAPIHQVNEKRTVSALGWRPPTQLTISGIVIDAGTIDLSPFDFHRARSDGVRCLAKLKARLQDPSRPPFQVTIGGVIYSSVFNPVDGRKNWRDLLAGFIWAFRDVPDATLLLKVTHSDVVLGVLPVLADIAKLGPFKCRVLIVFGLLPDHEYQALIDATSYTVNTSNGEGQCLPLMECMSAGRPAITPLHTAMLDYVDTDNSFVVRSTEAPAAWPHDPRQAIRCMRHVVSFTQLVKAYQKSFEVARDRPRQYAAMSAAATAALKRFCSDDVVASRLQSVLHHLGLPARSAWNASSGVDVRPTGGDTELALAGLGS